MQKAKASPRANGKKAPGSWSDHPERAARDAAHRESVATQEPKPSKETPKTVTVFPLERRTFTVRIHGDSSLICNHWSEKAMKQIGDKQKGKGSVGREKKDPEAEFYATLYRHPDGGYAFPSIAFKKAAVSACSSLGKAISKVVARQAFHVLGELVKIDGTPSPREDMVRIPATGNADIRYRAEFKQWACTLEIEYNARVLTAEQIVNLISLAGFAVGIGEWRIEKEGNHGRYHVDTEGE